MRRVVGDPAVEGDARQAVPEVKSVHMNVAVDSAAEVEAPVIHHTEKGPRMPLEDICAPAEPLAVQPAQHTRYRDDRCGETRHWREIERFKSDGEHFGGTSSPAAREDALVGTILVRFSSIRLARAKQGPGKPCVRRAGPQRGGPPLHEHFCSRSAYIPRTCYPHDSTVRFSHHIGIDAVRLGADQFSDDYHDGCMNQDHAASAGWPACRRVLISRGVDPAKVVHRHSVLAQLSNLPRSGRRRRQQLFVMCQISLRRSVRRERRQQQGREEREDSMSEAFHG